MSKKKKFKNKFKAEILNQLQQSDTAIKSEQKKLLEKKYSQDLPIEQNQINQYQYVKKDLIKIIIIVSILLLILIGITILGQKTDIINNFSNDLAKFLHLNQ